MQRQDATSERIPQVIRECSSVYLVPIGSIERHGPHLPLGTDAFIGDGVTRRAAEEEPVVIFTGLLHLGQIAEARLSKESYDKAERAGLRRE
jgi:creatinine amidohydrolase